MFPNANKRATCPFCQSYVQVPSLANHTAFSHDSGNAVNFVHDKFTCYHEGQKRMQGMVGYGSFGVRLRTYCETCDKHLTLGIRTHHDPEDGGLYLEMAWFREEDTGDYGGRLHFLSEVK